MYESVGALIINTPIIMWASVGNGVRPAYIYPLCVDVGAYD